MGWWPAAAATLPLATGIGPADSYATTIDAAIADGLAIVGTGAATIARSITAAIVTVLAVDPGWLRHQYCLG